MILFIIVLVGLCFRLTNIIKTQGLWNDEYVSWMISATPFKNGFFEEILKQCHMPLYYLYLKPFSSCSDLILRLTSVIPSIISIYIMYLVGKEFSKKNGIFCALITAFSSFLIFYSQEVRFYSLLFLFSTISLLFTIKLLKQTTKKNIFFYFLANLLILLTHHLGFIFVFFNFIYVLLKKRWFKSKIFLIILSLVVLCVISCIPIAKNILTMLPSSQWWGKFSYTNILFTFSDYFSPILTNHINAPSVFLYNPSNTIWLIVPTLIAFTGILIGAIQNKGLFTIALSYLLALYLLSYNGYLIFITKYSIEILPILILLFAFGLIKIKKIGNIVLAIFLLIHLIYFLTPNNVTTLYRNEGHKIVGDILVNKNSNNILFTYYDQNRFLRYIDLKEKNVFSINKNNRFVYLNNPASALDNIKPNETLSVVFLDSVSFFDKNFIEKNKNNPKIPEMFITFSTIKQELIAELDKNYKDFEIDKIEAWTVISCKKR